MRSNHFMVRDDKGRVFITFAVGFTVDLHPNDVMIPAAAIVASARRIDPNIAPLTEEQLSALLITPEQARLIDAVPEGHS